MDRREFLTRVNNVPFAVGVAGCSSRSADETTPTGETTTAASATSTDSAMTNTETDTENAPPGQYLNPVFEPVIPDPSVVRADGGFSIVAERVPSQRAEMPSVDVPGQ